MTQRKTLGLSEARDGGLAPVEAVPTRAAAPVKVARNGADGCERCEQLKEQVRQLREARDQALLDLAREREKTNALRLALPPVHQPSSSGYPTDVDPADVPLRYVIADRANKSLKSVLGPLHAALKVVGRSAVGATDIRKKR